MPLPKCSAKWLYIYLLILTDPESAGKLTLTFVWPCDLIQENIINSDNRYSFGFILQLACNVKV